MCEEYFSMKSEILKHVSFDLDPYEIQKKININSDYSEKINKCIKIDKEILSCQESKINFDNGKNIRLYSVYATNDQKDYLSTLSKNTAFFEECLRNTDLIQLKIRYLDFLVDFGTNFTYKNKIEYANELIENLQSYSEMLKDEKKIVSNYSRILDIYLKFNMKDKLSEFNKFLFMELKKFRKNQDYYTTYEILLLLNKLHSEIQNDGDLKKIKSFISSSIIEINKTKNKEDIDASLLRNFLLLLLRVQLKNQESEEILKKTKEDICDTYEIEMLKYKKNWVKAITLKKGLKYANDNGLVDKVNYFNLKIGKLLEDPQMEKFSFDLNNINKIIDEQVIDKIFSGELRKSFLNLYKHILDIMLAFKKKNLSTDSVIGDLCSHTYIKNNKIIGNSKINSDKSINEIYVDNYIIIYIKVLSYEFWMKMNENYDRDLIIATLKSLSFKNENNLILTNGLKRFACNDYISSIHILVPQFENYFRKCFKEKNVAPTRVNDKVTASQEDITFGSYIIKNKTILIKNTSEIYISFVEYLYLLEEGLNLRNDIAHGIIDERDCDFFNTFLVILSFGMLNNFLYN